MQRQVGGSCTSTLLSNAFPEKEALQQTVQLSLAVLDPFNLTHYTLSAVLHLFFTTSYASFALLGWLCLGSSAWLALLHLLCLLKPSSASRVVGGVLAYVPRITQDDSTHRIAARPIDETAQSHRVHQDEHASLMR